MKKITSVVVFMVGLVLAAPAFADSGLPNGDDQIKNIKSGSRNISTGWVEMMDSTHAEMSKGKNMPEQMTGLVAGTAIGARHTLHRVGAGAIDLLTFWIPKKQPLITPEKPRLQ